MRPIEKGTWPSNTPSLTLQAAKEFLYTRIGPYCCYCEEYSASLQNEHIVSVHQDKDKKFDWENLVLGCGNCNGQGNKGHQHVDIENTHFPHLDNTLLSFEYLAGGKIKVNQKLNAVEFNKATALFRLVGLDRDPSNPEYDSKSFDYRWKKRLEVWSAAQIILNLHQEAFSPDPDQVAIIAKANGHFSIWYTLFAAHPEVRTALIAAFVGTADDCFDPGNNYAPIARKRT